MPQFGHLRDNLYKKKVPRVDMEIGYQSKEDGEISVVNGTSNPVSRYPPSTYRRLYEIASVDVSFIINYIM